MREITGDLFKEEADATVITTNGFIKKNGEGVMGRGVAFQMKQKYPHAPAWLGNHLSRNGNHVGLCNLPKEGRCFVWFPVKHHWNDKAEFGLIKRSLKELVLLAASRWEKVVLPRAGCGNGGLDWKDVRPLLAEVLDDRFVVVEREEK